MQGDVNIYANIGIVSGSHTTLAFICRDEKNNPIPLASTTSFGCTFASADSGDIALFNITGTIDPTNSTGNVMLIEVASNLTKNLGDCLLYYYPYVIMGGKIIRPGQGKLTIIGSPPVG